MTLDDDVIQTLRSVLNLDPAQPLGPETPLLGSLPELDSMAVVAILTALEERLGITVDDDAIDGATFATVGSLVAFVREALGG